MKSFLLASLLSLAFAGPHPFRAESNFICRVCKSYASLMKTGSASLDDCRDATGKTYPVCEKLEQNQEDVLKALEDLSVEDFCTKMEACEVKTVLLGETQQKPAMDQETIDSINDANVGWKAGVNERFSKMTQEELKRTHLGTIVDPDYAFMLPKKEQLTEFEIDLPATFDARANWDSCKDVIGRVRDQSSCGSCWAFGSTEALNDRRCITSGNHTVLAAADTMECCKGFACGMSEGCNGGQPGAAWNWFQRTGVVTGADYSDEGKSDTCLPYPFAPCAHHVKTPDYPDCPKSEYRTPSCKRACTNSGYGKSYDSDKIKATKAYGLDGVQSIMQDIYQYGTVTAAFTVYADFPTYKSGVYKHTSGSALGGHAVKIIGWGTEGGEDYWLVVNSWNRSWGDMGLFKILRGRNECGIESQINAGRA